MIAAYHHPSERETQGAIDFDAALEGYACSYMEPEELLRAAGLVRGCTISLDPDHARAIARLTGAIVKLATYDDAGRAVQRWFASKEEAGVMY
jgi:hypothetical protein